MEIHQRYDIASWIRSSFPESYQFLMGRFNELPGIFVVGGAIRDFFSQSRPSDLDIALDGITSRELSEVPGLVSVAFTPDSIGGHVVRDGINLDMWPLRESYGFKELGLPATIEGLLMRCPLDLDMIALELKSATMYDSGAMNAMRCRRIAYRPTKPFMVEMQAARLILYQHKTGYELDETTQDHIKNVSRSLSEETEDMIAREVGKKYPELVQYVIERIRGAKRT